MPSRPREKEARAADGYRMFATTMPDSRMDNDPDKVAEFYRMRWGIENSHESYEQMRPGTTSRSHFVRLLLTMTPFMLYNVWTPARFMEARRAGVHDGEADRRPPCTPNLFMTMLVGAADRRFAAHGGRLPD